MTQLEPVSFVRRLVALIIDLGILYIIGIIISLFLGNYVMYFGNFKILIGVFISTVYFTVFHSKLFKGKSIGKRLMGIQVISQNGNYLSIGNSFLRTIIFTIPYCYSDLININFNSSLNLSQFVRYTIIPASLFINHAFSFTNRLSLCFHDIVAKSLVTSKLEPKNLDYSPINKNLKFLPLIAILLVLILSILIINPFSEQNLKDINELKTIEATITKNHSLFFSKFNYEFNDNEETNKALKIICFIPKQDVDMSSEVYLLTEELAPFKDKYKISKITLEVVKDFNLGIYSSWESIKNNQKQMKFDL